MRQCLELEHSAQNQSTALAAQARHTQPKPSAQSQSPALKARTQRSEPLQAAHHMHRHMFGICIAAEKMRVHAAAEADGHRATNTHTLFFHALPQAEANEHS